MLLSADASADGTVVIVGTDKGPATATLPITSSGGTSPANADAIGHMRDRWSAGTIARSASGKVVTGGASIRAP